MATGQQQRGIGLTADPKSRLRNEHEAEDITLRDFGGVNQRSPREDLGDNEFYWLEELMPIAPGNLAVVSGPPTAYVVKISGETGPPSYTTVVNIVGVPSIFAVWKNSGNAWFGPAQTSTGWTKIATAIYTSGATAATQWSNQGIVIVDATAGMRDYNLTAANTLTNLSGQAYAPVLNPVPGFNPGAVPVTQTISDYTGPGSGGTASLSLTAVSATITAGGTGYLVGDILVLTGGSLQTSTYAPLTDQNQATVITVTAVTVGGVVSGISFTNTGYYISVPANVASVTGGAGTGATFTLNWQFTDPFIITPGSGYVTPYYTSFPTLITFSTSGTILGTSVAAYAGRIWVAIKRTVQFTDVNSYSSFGGSGGSFTINDDYLVNNVNVIYAANNYLYIFGDTSLDILSNVAVVSGLVQFSRINVSASIGCTQPQSVFAWFRAVAFANSSGFYVVSGATPEKISDNLDTFFSAINFGTPIWGGQVMVNNILCATFLVNFNDSFAKGTPTAPVTRPIFCLFFKGKWWFTSQTAPDGDAPSVFDAITAGGLSVGHEWAGNELYPMFNTTNASMWLLKTKLWDGGEPLLDKQALKVGAGMVFQGSAQPGVSFYVDTENSSSLTNLAAAFNSVKWINAAGQIVQWVNNSGAVVQWSNNLSSYQLLVGTANAGGGKYLGITATGSSNAVQIRLLALQMEASRPW